MEYEEFSEKRIKEILATFSSQRENLITLLQSVQLHFGYLPKEAMTNVAKFLDISFGEVFGVASFYNQFRFNPPGRHQIKVCLGTACHVKGGDIILESWERRLEIKEGSTTPDREFSLERVACVGCCAIAPVCLDGEVIYGYMMTTKVDGIILGAQIEKEKRESRSET